MRRSRTGIVWRATLVGSLLAGGGALWSAPIRPACDISRPIDAGQCLDFHIDRARVIDRPAELQRLPGQAFTRARSSIVNLGVRDDQVWFRLRLRNPDDRWVDRYAVVAYPALDRVLFYAPDDRGRYSTSLAGDALPFVVREYVDRNFIFRFSVPPRGEYDYFFRVRMIGVLNFPLSILPARELQGVTLYGNILFGAYFGGVGFLILYNLFVYLVVRDRAYLYYVVYNSWLFFLMFSTAGFAFQFLWPTRPDLNALFGPHATIFSALFGLLAARSFLNTGALLPHIHRVLGAVAGLALLAAVAALFVSFPVRISVAYVTMLSAILAVVAAGALAVRAGYRPAVFYLLAHGIIMAFGVINMLTGFGLAQKSFWTEYGVFIGNALETLLFSMGLGYRFRQAEHEKNAAIRSQAETQIELSAVRREIEIAEQILFSLLPQRPPSPAGAAISVTYLPVEHVGGDFYDFVNGEDGGVGVFIADVEGHGLPAAMYASMVKSVFLSQARHYAHPDRLLAGLGEHFTGERKYGMLTAAYLYLDVRRRCLRYARSGHPPLLLARPGSSVIEYAPRGFALGFPQRSQPELLEIEVCPGDRLILCTDGLIELRNHSGEYFGNGRLAALLDALPSGGGALSTYLVDQAVRFTAGRAVEDDITLITLEIQG